MKTSSWLGIGLCGLLVATLLAGSARGGAIESPRALYGAGTHIGIVEAWLGLPGRAKAELEPLFSREAMAGMLNTGVDSYYSAFSVPADQPRFRPTLDWERLSTWCDLASNEIRSSSQPHHWGGPIHAFQTGRHIGKASMYAFWAGAMGELEGGARRALTLELSMAAQHVERMVVPGDRGTTERLMAIGRQMHELVNRGQLDAAGNLVSEVDAIVRTLP